MQQRFGHILYWKGGRKKIIVIDSIDDKENKKRRRRKRKNKDRIDEISQGLLINQKNKNNCSKKIANCSPRNRTKKAKQKKNKIESKN